MPAFKILLKRAGRMQVDAAATGDARHEQMLLVGHAGLFVVDDFMIAIEREAVFHVAANPKDGNGFVGGARRASRSASGRAE